MATELTIGKLAKAADVNIAPETVKDAPVLPYPKHRPSNEDSATYQ